MLFPLIYKDLNGVLALFDKFANVFQKPLVLSLDFYLLKNCKLLQNRTFLGFVLCGWGGGGGGVGHDLFWL